MLRTVVLLSHRALRNRAATTLFQNTDILLCSQFHINQNTRDEFRFPSLRPLMYSTYSFTRRVPDPNDPATLMKEDGVVVCSQMWIENFREPKKTVNNLTNYLRRFELWVLAYQKVCADETGAYMPRSSVTRSALEDLLALRNAILDDRFKWGARLEFFIRSPKDKTDYESLSKRKIRAIMTTKQPSPFQDRIVQEVLFMILEPVYEARFSQKSFAFRPGRNAHTVLRVIRRSFAGYLWYIKGDVSTVLDGMKVGMVISALMRDVRDKKVIDLIKAALTTPVITGRPDDGEKKKKIKRKYQKKRVLADDEPKPDPYWLESFFGFAPEEAEIQPSWGHCGIISPLLANICLDELDHWMEDKIKEFYKPSSSDVIWNSPDGDGEQGNTSWPEFVPTSGPDKTRKIDYIRYGGHILIGVRGPRADAATLRKQLIEFCDQKYMLKLDNESLPIEHITKGIMFLDHVLSRRVVYPTLRYTATGGKIISEKGVGTLLSVTASLKQCIRQFRKLQFVKGDRDPDPQPCFRMFHATQAHTNAQMNKFLSTIVEWYRYADNRKKIVNFCSYIIRGSLAKLYAAKYKLRSRAKVYKIGARNLSRPLKEKKGQSPEYHNLLRMGLVESIDGLQYTRMSLVPETDYSPFPAGWRPDHEKALIEYIRLEDPKTLEEQRECLREEGLISPQDYVSMLVWNYKRNAISVGHFSSMMSDEKKILRTKVKKDLKSMDPTLRSQEDDVIQSIVLEAPWFESCRRLCAYISCGALREVDTSKILSEILKNTGQDEHSQVKKKLYVPRVEDKNSYMRMLHISRMDDLVANSMNILEPAEGNERENVMFANEPVDLFLLPGLAFDKSGRRLGRGGGYYDTFLTKYQELAEDRNWKKPLFVALSYSVQILEDDVIPLTPNDVPVDALISPSGVIPISPLANEMCS